MVSLVPLEVWAIFFSSFKFQHFSVVLKGSEEGHSSYLGLGLKVKSRDSSLLGIQHGGDGRFSTWVTPGHPSVPGDLAPHLPAG